MITYDRYIKTPESKIFIELSLNRRYTPIFRDRLYMQLSKISFYRNIKNVSALLKLVFICLPEDSNTSVTISKIINDFQPAISNNLLELYLIEITEDELSSIKT